MVLAAILTCPLTAWSQIVRDDFSMANGPVHAIAAVGNTIYMGGDFTHVGPPTGSAGIVSADTGRLLDNAAVHGTVYAVAADGAGGYFIGGLFDRVGGMPRTQLAHIRGDGAVSSWAPQLGERPGRSIIIFSIVVSGRTVFVRGIFGSVNGQPRSGLAAINAETGAVKPWNPEVDETTLVGPLAVSGGRVYITRVDIVTHAVGHVVAVDTTNGIGLFASPPTNGWIIAIAVHDSTVYVGGQFTLIDGQPRRNIAALDAETLALTSWNPGAHLDVHALTVHDSTLYVGGVFPVIAGQLRNRLAAFNTTDGSLTPWTPGMLDGGVDEISVFGSTVYVGGDFREVDGVRRTNAAAFDAGSAVLRPWDPGANVAVNALLASESRVFVGGSFHYVGGAPRRNIAALEASSGTVTDWNPSATGIVRTLVVEGPWVFAGGSFDSIGGQRRSRIGAVNTETGLASDWNPNSNGTVRALIHRDGICYVGGSFTQIGGEERGRIAALDASTAMATAWNPSADSTVRALAINDQFVFAGGSFQRMGGRDRPLIAAIDVATGTVPEWGAAVAGGSPDVYALAVKDSTVYVAGDFTQMGGQPRRSLAAVAAATGNATSWMPQVQDTYYSLEVPGTDVVYAGGVAGISAFDAHAGTLTWGFDTSGDVYATVTSGRTIFVGGAYTQINGVGRTGIAAIDDIETSTLLSEFFAETVDAGIRLRWRFAEPRPSRVWLERAPSLDGPWIHLALDFERHSESEYAVDLDVEPGRAYCYRLVAEYGNGTTTFEPITAVAGGTRGGFALVRVGPTPSTGRTEIEFTIAWETRVRLRILDLQGRTVATLVDAVRPAGRHSVVWSGENRSTAGVYFLHLEAGGLSLARRLVLRR